MLIVLRLIHLSASSKTLDYVSRYVMVRDVMNCSSIEECVNKLKEIKVASPFSLNIVDTKNNKVINVEKDTDEVYIKEIDDRWARSNHFIIKSTDLSKIPESTKFRHEKPKELLDKLDKSAKISDLKENRKGRWQKMRESSLHYHQRACSTEFLYGRQGRDEMRLLRP